MTLRYIRSIMVLALIIAVTSGCGGGGGGGSVGTSIPNVTPPSVPTPITSTSTITTPNLTGDATPTPSPSPSATATPGPGTINNGTQQALNPAAPPSFPSAPPPLLSNTKSAVKDASTSTPIALLQGWNLISFPFAQLTSASGFTHALYTYNLGTFTAVDPVNSPSSVDTRLAYLAYADESTVVTVAGTANTGQIGSVSLVQGWNMVGCPYADNLQWANMSATRMGVTRALDEVATASQAPDSSWLSRYAYGLIGGTVAGDDILAPGDALIYSTGRWLFVWQDMELNLGTAPPQPPPQIVSLSESTLTAGDTLTINGSGFATSDAGTVTIGGIGVPPTSITSWSASTIVLTVPDGIQSGNLIVFVNLYPSNRIPVTTGSGGSSGADATLIGLVQDNAGNPLAGTQILIDSGQSAVADSGGNFTITDIPAGDHLVIASHIGNNVGKGVISFGAGQTKSVLVTLSPVSGGSGGGGSGGGGSTQHGALTAIGYPFTSGGAHWYVSQIIISEYGNYSNRWTNNWFEDTGDTYHSVTADNAVVGRTYVVRMTWKNANNGSTQSGFWYVKLDSTSQTDTHYNP